MLEKFIDLPVMYLVISNCNKENQYAEIIVPGKKQILRTNNFIKTKENENELDVKIWDLYEHYSFNSNIISELIYNDNINKDIRQEITIWQEHWKQYSTDNDFAKKNVPFFYSLYKKIKKYSLIKNHPEPIGNWKSAIKMAFNINKNKDSCFLGVISEIEELEYEYVKIKSTKTLINDE